MAIWDALWADFWGFPAGVFGAALGAAGLLWLSWVVALGPLRAFLAVLCRALWMAPLFLAFFPKTDTEQLPRSVILKTVHVLIDDSSSMLGSSPSDSTAPIKSAESILAQLNADCARLGCLPKVSRLSELDASVKKGVTPLSSALESWLYRVSGEPWVLVSDGGDQRPTEPWPLTLRGTGRASEPSQAPRGAIVGFQPVQRYNVWIKEADVPPFSFEGRPVPVPVVIRRSQASPGTERVQLQVLAQDSPLATANVEFPAGELEAQVTASVPPLPRGQHLLTVRALPTAEETSLWDNAVHAVVEVMPNTVGVLHLLGSPSWDGRFLRRYLKAEPKYDLISFFILRDPWDSQQVNERELSLIPFPVERLFREELPSFRVVVIQNFTLFQFLLPEYQNNLVKFVQNGGGLLFIGGPRALTASDLGSSPLKAILPFEVGPDLTQTSPNLLDLGGLDTPIDPDQASEPPTADKGPAYDGTAEFRVALSKPSPEKRALANVYEDWEALAPSLTEWHSAKGLNRIDRVKLKPETTTLLTAKTGSGEVPLAVASYPGKGRALWLFSDAFYKLALTPSDVISRQIYNRFMHGAMTWLMRQDLRQPLVAKPFSLHGGQRPSWTVKIHGPAARYYQPETGWRLSICGVVTPPEKFTAQKQSGDEWELSGPLPTSLAGGERCTFELEGSNAAFGSVKARVTAVYPETFEDKDIDAAPEKLEQLAQLTGAALAFVGESSSPPAGKKPDQMLEAWLASATGQDGVAIPSRFKTIQNFFWVLDMPWFWLLLLALPCEVLVRRWEQLTGKSGKGRILTGASGDAQKA